MRPSANFYDIKRLTEFKTTLVNDPISSINFIINVSMNGTGYVLNYKPYTFFVKLDV